LLNFFAVINVLLLHRFPNLLGQPAGDEKSKIFPALFPQRLPAQLRVLLTKDDLNDLVLMSCGPTTSRTGLLLLWLSCRWRMSSWWLP
jgi:hypothetical protein